MRRNGAILNCVVCNKEFYVPQYRLQEAKYCSKDCQNKGQYEYINKVCIGCGKEFKVSNSKVKKQYCTIECRGLGKKDIVERRKQIKAYQKLSRGASTRSLRNNLFKLRECKCDICGYDEYSFCIEVHHIDENPRNNEINNLAVLCVICHRKLHKGVIDNASIKRNK